MRFLADMGVSLRVVEWLRAAGHLRNTRTPRVIERLGTVVERCGPPLAQGAIVVVEDARHRLRRLPLHP